MHTSLHSLTCFNDHSSESIDSVNQLCSTDGISEPIYFPLSWSRNPNLFQKSQIYYTHKKKTPGHTLPCLEKKLFKLLNWIVSAANVKNVVIIIVIEK